jgi:Fe2+ or Zn2+ uptake regulation protein
LLEDLGKVRRVPASSGAVLFDSRTEPHDHFVCRRCGAVTDLDCATDHAQVLETAAALGLCPDDAQVVVSGFCASCAACGAGHN